MAWRPTRFLVEGELDNTTKGKVVGWMRFAGLPEIVTFDLKGDFHRDIRGAKITFIGDNKQIDDNKALYYIEGFALKQTGTVGDMTAGLPPQDYIAHCYLEWYGEVNGRVVIELDTDQVQIIGQPQPANKSKPIDRSEQHQNMKNYMLEMAQEFGQHSQQTN
ncbi:hypothetical protein ACFL02_07690 [Planctomycetota bacterium]